MNSKYNDIGGMLTPVGLGIGASTACDGANATVVSGVMTLTEIDSVCVVANVDVTLASGETLSLGINYETSANNSNWNTPVTGVASAVVATGESGGSTEYTAVKLALDTASFPKYIRFTAVPDFSATSTDTGLIGFSAVYSPRKTY